MVGVHLTTAPMNLYILVECDDIGDIAQNITSSIGNWLPEVNDGISLVNHRMSSAEFAGERPGQRDWELGLLLSITSKAELKEPLNFLYSVAKQNQCEFVVGIQHDANNKEDVCYFGNEEGRPDVHEVAMYLGL